MQFLFPCKIFKNYYSVQNRVKIHIFPLKFRNPLYTKKHKNPHILPQEVLPGAGGKKGRGSMNKLADRSFLLATYKSRAPGCSRATSGTASPESLLYSFEQWHNKAAHHSHHKKIKKQLPSGDFISALEWFPTDSGNLLER